MYFFKKKYCRFKKYHLFVCVCVSIPSFYVISRHWLGARSETTWALQTHSVFQSKWRRDALYGESIRPIYIEAFRFYIGSFPSEILHRKAFKVYNNGSGSYHRYELRRYTLFCFFFCFFIFPNKNLIENVLQSKPILFSFSVWLL